MRPPIPLRADPGTDSSLRAALLAAKRTPPVEYDDEAGLGRFSATIGTALVASSVATKSATVAAKSGKLAVLSFKWIGVGVLATGLLAGAVVVAAKHWRMPAVGDAPAARRASDVNNVVPRGATVEQIAPPKPLRETTAEPTPSAATSSAPRTPPSAEASVKEEIRQFEEMKNAEASNPGRALELADEGQARFPNGVFGQEREAHAIFALRRLGREDEARARAARFIERHPESPFVGILGGDPPKP